MKRSLALFTITFIATCAQAQQKALMGFTPASLAKQLQTEQQFDKSISSVRILSLIHI